MANNADQRPIEPTPPVGRTWGRVYGFVLFVLAAVICALWALSRWFS